LLHLVTRKFTAGGGEDQERKQWGKQRGSVKKYLKVPERKKKTVRDSSTEITPLIKSGGWKKSLLLVEGELEMKKKRRAKTTISQENLKSAQNLFFLGFRPRGTRAPRAEEEGVKKKKKSSHEGKSHSRAL